MARGMTDEMAGTPDLAMPTVTRRAARGWAAGVLLAGALLGGVAGRLAADTARRTTPGQPPTARALRPAPNGARSAMYANVQDYGAVGDGRDDSAAIQQAIDSIVKAPPEHNGPRGGTLFFPKGNYRLAHPLVATKAFGLTLLGEGTQTSFRHAPASALTYTGAGAAPFLAANGSHGLTVRNIGIRYTNSGFTGDLVSIQEDAAYAVFENCLLAGGDGEAPVSSAHSLISMYRSYLHTVRGCHLEFAQRGVEGKRAPGFGFSNAILIQGNTFDHLRVGAIVNPGQAFSVRDNWFEGTQIIDGTGLVRAVYDELPLAPGGEHPQIVGLVFEGNWMGDSDLNDAKGNVVWISSVTSQFVGAKISGNSFLTGNVGVRFGHRAEGVSIDGNVFWVSTVGVDLGHEPAAGVAISGNTFKPGPRGFIAVDRPAGGNIVLTANNEGSQ
jgi:hypothetical protein